jgi:hypothetical protein
MRSAWLRSSLASRVLVFEKAHPHIFYPAAFLVCFEMAVMFNDARQVLHNVWRFMPRV